ncbi:rRNA adenine N-6-methyltransferase family protein [Pseudactinotalea suaedae]|uniref:rRNA adenine N-6-methyltransferase family protein n=1 Tax=Pseudactinotalea suaedae TaxID=1524924 RepID=UPI0012E2A27C|nr:rRNA adenine N-6-methyltransferase family protein [Pseudactinotalea suaedae]
MSGNRSGSRRSWGWHPLRSDWAERVVEATSVRRGDLVLDLGAGDGALTAPLVAAGARVLAVELHARRAAALRERFGDADVRVLEVGLADLRLPRRPFRVVANPPFGGSTDLVRSLLAAPSLLSADLVLQRAAARQWADRRRVRRRRLDLGLAVPRSAFRPPPRVDAAVLQIR